MARIVGTVVAGFPSPAEQYLEPPLDLNAYLIQHPPATFLLRVAGDSMSGAGILVGDLLIVDRSLMPRNGDIVVVAIDGDFTAKYFRRNKEGVRLEAANPNYTAIFLRHNQRLDYFGKVVGVVRRIVGERKKVCKGHSKKDKGK